MRQLLVCALSGGWGPVLRHLPTTIIRRPGSGIARACLMPVEKEQPSKASDQLRLPGFDLLGGHTARVLAREELIERTSDTPCVVGNRSVGLAQAVGLLGSDDVGRDQQLN